MGAPSSPLSAHQEKVSPTTALWLDVYCWRAGLRLQRRDALSRGHLRTTIWIWQPRSINIETVILYFLETFPYILEVYFLPCNDTENISSTISFDLILQWILLGLFSGSLSTRIPIWTTKVTFRSHLVAHKTSRIHPNRDSQCLRVLRKTAFQWRHIFQTSVWDRNSDYKGIFFVKSWDSRHLGKVVRIEFSSCWYQARRGGSTLGVPSHGSTIDGLWLLQNTHSYSSTFYSVGREECSDLGPIYILVPSILDPGRGKT